MSNKKKIIDLKKLCDEKGIRIEDVASEVGVGYPTLRRYMRDAGGIKYGTLKKIQDVFGKKNPEDVLTEVE